MVGRVVALIEWWYSRDTRFSMATVTYHLILGDQSKRKAK